MRVQNYTLQSQIGFGSFSTVYKAYNRQDGKYYAIKSMREMSRNNEEVVQNEIDLLKKVAHKNIVGYVTDFKEKGKWYIVFEYCEKGDMRKFLNQQGRLPEQFCKNLAYSIVSVLAFLHQNNIVHRDLKLENVLINDAFGFKLADFGFSKDNDSQLMVSFCGTPTAMAPEILKREPYDDRCDTWSLGVMLYEMVYGRLPFVANKKQGFYGLAKCVIELEPVYDKGIQISQPCVDFIKLCLKKDKNKRPRMKALMGHEWIIDAKSRLDKDQMIDFMEKNTEIVNNMKEVFHGAIQEHISKIIVKFNLLDSEIKKYMGYFDKYFDQRKETKAHIILLITKIIREIDEQKICIEIEGSNFKVSLNKIRAFQTHINNLKEFLNSQKPQNLDINPKLNIEREIIKFVVSEAQSCLKVLQNIPDKNQLLMYVSKLPIQKYVSSHIRIKWSFKEEGTRNQRLFCENLDQIREQDIIKFANQHYADEDIKSNWIIEHESNLQRREGEQIMLGEYVSRVIQINMEPDY